MKFSEKLNFLMNLTNTSNSTLALQVNIDASHISRMRRGERNAPKNEASIHAMSAYFGKHCKEDYQQKALCDVLNLSPETINESRLPELISKWLMENGKGSQSVESFLTGIANMKSKQSVGISFESDSKYSESYKSEVIIYYGIDGKRQAAIDFIEDMLAKSKPITMFFLSEESTEWMSGDREFSSKWTSMMTELLTKGSRIIIIHTLNRDLDEMLNAISQWLPLYMLGAIDPYYYPKKRDGLFKRSLFIAQNTEAIVSTSIGDGDIKAANVLYKDKNAVAAFEREFKEYFNLCKPLMKVFTLNDQVEYLNSILAFDIEQSPAIIKTISLSLLTMPRNVAVSIISRLKETDQDILDYALIRYNYFNHNINKYSFTEIVQLYDIEDVLNGKVMVAFPQILSVDAVNYTVEEYVNHLENILYLLKTHENFHVCFENEVKQEKFMFYAKENVGVFVTKTSVPPATIYFSEDNLKAAFWDYLLSIISSNYFGSRKKDDSEKRLNEYIRRIKEANK